MSLIHFIGLIDARRPEPTFDLRKGPSYGWFKRFKNRHKKAISLRTPSKLDGGKACMARQSIMDQHFAVVKAKYDRLIL